MYLLAQFIISFDKYFLGFYNILDTFLGIGIQTDKT